MSYGIRPSSRTEWQHLRELLARVDESRDGEWEGPNVWKLREVVELDRAP